MPSKRSEPLKTHYRSRNLGPLLGGVTPLATAGALDRGGAPGVALIALLRGHHADDESAFGDSAFHLLLAHRFLRVLKLPM
jgi:hypothetical protein